MVVDEGQGSKPLVTEVLASAAGDDVVRRFFLLVTAGPDAGASFATKGERTVLGTHESADVVLHDNTVSRFHCEILLSAARATLRDLGSSNGTLVNGVPVIESHLRGGMTLGLGKTQLRLDLIEERAGKPLPTREEFGLLVGPSAAMRRVFALLECAAASDATVLLAGETGTGKEAAAESLHREGARRDGPFVVVDCSAIPSELLESELFGHERGAFTGAVETREGAFEAADGGTLFLDEIGELSLALQPKLLRALERREVKRVGANRYVPVDVRVVAATNRDLRAEVNAQRFRPDLYYRLAVLDVRLPPLRERREDLPVLVEHLLGRLGLDTSPKADLVRSPEFLAELAQHAWPGNVRELRNYVERCLALSQRTPLESEATPGFDVSITRPLKAERERCVAAVERRYLEQVLAAHDGNVTAAARTAGVDRCHLYRLLWRHGLR